jgi:hydrogenase maturation protein HypF
MWVEDRPSNGFTGFEISSSVAIQDAFQPISSDVCICPDCLRELFDPTDRRYRYPFTNCTNCGPRFTIIKDIPYDRPKTTMASFTLCPQCASEYQNPLDRRFHAQPVACPTCGPQVWLEFRPISGVAGGKTVSGDDAILATQRLLSEGKIVAIKGLGGFHLACDASNPAAVAGLRSRKLRVDKAFALMMPDVSTVENHCLVSRTELEQLESIQRPIVILNRRVGSSIAEQVSPGQHTLGVMLPYTPLHYLLFAPHPKAPGFAPPFALVMTSGNLVEEPIAFDNEDARNRLGVLADAFLMHDRPIHTRCDDSVVRVVGFPGVKPLSEKSSFPQEFTSPLRRSRGYAPFPVHLPWKAAPILATGAELKNTFCLTRENYAFLSHHIGDMENFETLKSFEEGIAHYERLFRIKPVAIAYDLHPDYLASRYALQRAEAEELPAIGIQHHHAHIAACMAEHGLDGNKPVIGVAFDGTGYGHDGNIWGGEFLISSYHNFRRAAHLKYVPLAGGDRATKEPWRIALSWLKQAGCDWDEALPPVKYALGQPSQLLQAIRHQLTSGINAPNTSSMGRLFDAAASLVGIRQVVNYEAQAAIEFESLADPEEMQIYPFTYSPDPDRPDETIIDPTPLIIEIIRDLQAGLSQSIISGRFHNAVAEMVRVVVLESATQEKLSQVVLSGGVMQNKLLLVKIVNKLVGDGYEVLFHTKVPANDGGLALGQAVIGCCRLEDIH